MKKGSKKYDDPVCIVEGCEKTYYAKRYCRNHYSNFLRCGDPLGTRKLKVKCKHPRCDKLSKSKGYCNLHYQRKLSGNDMDAPLKRTKHIDRDKAIALMYEHRYTLQSIGDILGITRQRVEQIVARERKSP